ncbi:hypothetical protein [Acetonema longum]|uniref:Uncharacterized protein n=1 Tax=Acetonema longum DSM 6540 TaxID=1009370 RepID=F7NG33_9FIRM|nr:hypothetical protein [Acetonema longum]EGO64951.1 hypothetical protein ALO_05098 [Acetonema longum DSM 6540]
MTLRPLMQGAMNDPWLLLQPGQTSPIPAQPTSASVAQRYREWSEAAQAQDNPPQAQPASAPESSQILKSPNFAAVASSLAQRAHSRLKSSQEHERELHTNVWYREKSIRAYREVIQGFPEQTETTSRINFIA